ncbi:hypothetical protein CYLTODRAFT_426804 [Cylindrobasidium torrendii FP15055 ss-10]|uniref:Uncharacterized protein n=1 Tax=Cylindrobasidium torrendii FP15055 ss-10 TaxID=1314674 RepID=A0A0D7AX65_9AGAR|nr:hypothetical protein CYLTODRAFT_426804 [Cylindrobasidium torrendii FP15055 ss-10]
MRLGELLAGLPTDICRLIFEEYALQSTKSALKLLYVSKTVGQWIKPLLYYDVSISQPAQTRGLLDSLQRQDVITTQNALSSLSIEWTPSMLMMDGDGSLDQLTSLYRFTRTLSICTPPNMGQTNALGNEHYALLRRVCQNGCLESFHQDVGLSDKIFECLSSAKVPRWSLAWLVYSGPPTPEQPGRFYHTLSEHLPGLTHLSLTARVAFDVSSGIHRHFLPLARTGSLPASLKVVLIVFRSPRLFVPQLQDGIEDPRIVFVNFEPTHRKYDALKHSRVTGLLRLRAKPTTSSRYLAVNLDEMWKLGEQIVRDRLLSPG